MCEFILKYNPLSLWYDLEGGHDSCEDARSCMELMKYKFKEDQKRKRLKGSSTSLRWWDRFSLQWRRSCFSRPKIKLPGSLGENFSFFFYWTKKNFKLRDTGHCYIKDLGPSGLALSYPRMRRHWFFSHSSSSFIHFLNYKSLSMLIRLSVCPNLWNCSCIPPSTVRKSCVGLGGALQIPFL